ncbi:hypothetical protein HPB47_007147 [Ixodes persulcatus]|uniref:Uncharacterized protein n=1 Tax=Ixodes persulcatus TaxID=34615 RepID=A0AC60P8D9_IXOPE|nr:hypothetical protein HPB47_007147 [Ixodes persulcatus]
MPAPRAPWFQGGPFPPEPPCPTAEAAVPAAAPPAVPVPEGPFEAEGPVPEQQGALAAEEFLSHSTTFDSASGAVRVPSPVGVSSTHPIMTQPKPSPRPEPAETQGADASTPLHQGHPHQFRRLPDRLKDYFMNWYKNSPTLKELLD